MAAATVPSVAGLPLPRKGLREHLRGLRARVTAIVRPAAAPLANLAASPLHAAGLACIDAGVFTASLTAGLIVTGFSLIWLEHVIADEP